MSDKRELRPLQRRLRSLRYMSGRYLAAYATLPLALAGGRHALPDFLVIGAMKCGTSTLFHYLTQHPGVLPPRTKEIHYFDNSRFHRLGERWYRAQFPSIQSLDAQREQLGYRAITGEATPALMSGDFGASVHTLLPEVKLIAILRNPVDRAYSHYLHNCRSYFGEPMTFWDALQAEDQRAGVNASEVGQRRYSYAGRGMYIDRIESWMQHFPREQFCILRYEQLLSEPAALCNDVAAFLGLPAYEPVTGAHRNAGHFSEAMEPRCKDYLTERFRPHNRRLFEFLGEDWGWPA